MKKFSIFLVFIALTAFVFNNCSDSSNPLQNQDGINNLDKKVKPPMDSPEIEIFEVLPDGFENGSITLPQDEKAVKIHYRINHASTVNDLVFMIDYNRFEPAPNSIEHILFNPVVYHQIINSDGGAVIDQIFEWDGAVLSDFSSTGFLFDQFATDGPDEYLISLWVSNTNASATVLVNPANAVDPFTVTGVEAFWKKPPKSGGKWRAELFFRVTCSETNFKGSGRWEVLENGTFKCCPNYQIDSHGEDFAETVNPFIVGPGKYRFVVKFLYNPNFSYDGEQTVSNEIEID